MVSTRKGGTKSAKGAGTKEDQSAREPLELDLTVRFNFGKEPEDSVTVLDGQRVPMVNSVFASRDLLARGFIRMFVKAGLTQPKVVRELMPAVKLLRRSR